MNKTVAILLAAGKSERFGNYVPKPFLLLNGKVVFRYSLDVLLVHPKIDIILFVVPEHLLLTEQEKLKKENFTKSIFLIAGGVTRFESVQNALNQLQDDVKNVLIHDAARPFLSKELIDVSLNSLEKNKAVSCAIESTDTLVFSTNDKCVESYPDRNKIQRIQTPQAFDVSLLKMAYSLAQKEARTDFTDDGSIIHYFNLAPVFLVPGNAQNIKITYPTDLLLAEFMLNGKLV